MRAFARTLTAAFTLLALAAPGATAEETGFSPPQRTKSVDVGKTEKLDYKLHLPPGVTRPLDVYLLVDASSSMAGRLTDLRPALAQGVGLLAGRHGDLRVGVGEFRTTAPNDRLEGYTYRLLASVAPVTGNTYAAIDRLGRERPRLPQLVSGSEAHTYALSESVGGRDGAGEQAAGFRAHAHKVVVLVTDEAFATDPTQPSRSEAVATLRAADVRVAGLALDAGALEDLAAVAAGTDNRSTTSVDCGASRIAAGAPAACLTSAWYAGRVLERLFAAQSGEVRFVTTGSAVRRVEPASRWVDLTRKNKIDVKVEVGCATYDAGRTHGVTLSALVGGRTVAVARAFITCKAR